MDPAELWKRWYETSMGVWSNVLQQGQRNYADPYGLYRQWFETVQDLQESVTGADAGLAKSFNGASSGVAAALPSAAQQELWGKFFDATVESWQKSIGLGQETVDLTPRWLEMLEQARNNLLSLESFPKDPLEFAVQWYNATNGPFGEFVQDVVEREEFLEASSRWMQNYASLYRIFSRQSEEYLRNLQIPVRSDISRIAGLIVALEDKVDRIEEAFEDFEDGYAKPATAEEVGELDKRLDRVEGKLDRLLTALENGPAENGGSGAPAEIRATDAARRKARELGVDLAAVSGTGAGGQITVEDVRQKGDN